MSTTNKTYQPVQIITVKALQEVPAYRFVNHRGQLCSDNQKSLGVTPLGFPSGTFASVITLGVAIVESSSTINIGDKITSDSVGKAKVAPAGAEINGYALSSANPGDFLRILLTP